MGWSDAEDVCGSTHPVWEWGGGSNYFPRQQLIIIEPGEHHTSQNKWIQEGSTLKWNLDTPDFFPGWMDMHWIWQWQNCFFGWRGNGKTPNRYLYISYLLVMPPGILTIVLYKINITNGTHGELHQNKQALKLTGLGAPW